MIKADELRTGNYILYTPGPNDTQMVGGNINLLNALQGLGTKFEIATVKVENLGDETINSLSENQFEPIQLTQELLENCGFKRSGDSSAPPSGPYHKGLCEITVHNEFYAPQFFQPNGTALLHLHELQNWYFSLTNEHLEVKF